MPNGTACPVRVENGSILHPSDTMRYILLFIACFPLGVAAQNTSCRPQPNTISTCDSIRKICRVDAYYLTMLSVSKPASHWYDSLFYPEELMVNYTNAMIALHNDLPDTLADFRMYHYPLYPLAKFHPDSTFIVTIQLPYGAADREAKDLTQSGNRRIDSLINAAGMIYIGKTLMASLDVLISYRCPPNVNRAFVERRLKSIHPEISMSHVLKYTPFTFPIEASEGPDAYAISLLEISACKAPEIPCRYIRRTFVYREEWPLQYTTFERGVIPWPRPTEEK